MTTLRLVLDRLVSPGVDGDGRYAENLAREIIARAPRGTDVEALLPKIGEEELTAFERRVPGLVGVVQAPMRAERLMKAWQRGLFTGLVGGGFIHAMGLFAPLRDISLSYGIDQTVVTVHDTTAFRRPELMDPAVVKWRQAMLRRAHRFASAVVAPTNAVADELMELYDFGDRLRVIGAAPAPSIALPDSEAEGDRIAERLGLPDDYVLTLAGTEPRKGLAHLLRAMASPDLSGVRLVIVGRDGEGSSVQRTPRRAQAPEATGTQPGEPAGSMLDALLAQAGVPAERIVALGEIDDTELAVVYQRASALVVPSLEAGFGLPIVEAFHFGTPVVHSDAPALAEVGMDATVVVERGSPDSFHERLAQAVSLVVSSPDVERRLRIAGRDRSGVYRWEFAADQVWTLHADI